MQSSLAAAPAPASSLHGPDRGPVYWTIVLGGLVLALGTVVTGSTHFDILILTNGPMTIPASIGVFQLESALTGLGSLLTAVGFFAAFFGIAFALRTFSREPHRAYALGFRALIVGGSFLAAGFVAASVLAFYNYTPLPLDYRSYYVIDLAAHITEALGFLIGFVGVAEALRAQPGDGVRESENAVEPAAARTP